MGRPVMTAAANEKFNWKDAKPLLGQQGVTLISAGLTKCPWSIRTSPGYGRTERPGNHSRPVRSQLVKMPTRRAAEDWMMLTIDVPRGKRDRSCVHHCAVLYGPPFSDGWHQGQAQSLVCSPTFDASKLPRRLLPEVVGAAMNSQTLEFRPVW